jgi:hypothetical protein
LSNSIKTQTADALRSLDNAGCNAFLILAVSDDLASVVSLGHELGLTGTDKLWVGRELHTFFNDAAIPFPRAAVISAVQVSRERERERERPPASARRKQHSRVFYLPASVSALGQTSGTSTSGWFEV